MELIVLEVEVVSSIFNIPKISADVFDALCSQLLLEIRSPHPPEHVSNKVVEAV